MDTARQNHVLKLEQAKRELETAGPIHRKDLIRSIRRMEKELIIYDRYQRQARFSH